ncbi:hypothetical protein [Halosimplex rubrum]|nr:hypothetical protein [Halosimplex rubrum]
MAISQLLRFDRIDADRSDLEPLSSLYGLESLPCELVPGARPAA